MSDVITRTGVGGESAPPTYEYLRVRLRDLFLFAGVTALTADVEKNGETWQVASGVVNTPKQVWHEYAATFRTTNTPTGAWYEAEIANAAGRPIIGFAFAPEGGYQVLQYNAAEGAMPCLDDATEGQVALMTETVDRTLLDGDMARRASLEFTMATPDPELL
jgi:hypothetical protein